MDELLGPRDWIGASSFPRHLSFVISDPAPICCVG